MKRSNVLGADKKAIEHQLAVKKAEYASAMKQGMIFSDLKEIFLEIKALQQKLQVYATGTATINTEMRTAL